MDDAVDKVERLRMAGRIRKLMRELSPNIRKAANLCREGKCDETALLNALEP